MKILHLIDSFDCDSSTRQLQLLGPNLKQLGVGIEICCLGPVTPALQALRRAGVIVHALDWTRWIDPGVLWNLRAVVRESAPDVIHVWRLPALRALALAAKSMLPRAVVSASWPTRGKLAWWDRWLLEQTHCLAFAGRADQEQCSLNEIRTPIMRVVAPAVVMDEPLSVPKSARADDARNIVYLGRMDRTDGARHAIWAFDILLHIFHDIRLQMVGADTNSPEVRDLADGLGVTPHVDYLGVCPDLARLLRDATIVWLPRMVNRGRQAALDAMAHGRVVIGSDVPCLREVIRDHETGFLVPAGNVMDVARRTRLILQDDVTRLRMEGAARQFVEQEFALADTVSQWRELYRTVAA